MPVLCLGELEEEKVDLIHLPTLWRVRGRVSFRKQRILICSRRAAKKSLPMSSHVERLLTIATQANLTSRVPRRHLRTPGVCLSSNSRKVLQATRFSRCVLFGRTHTQHQVLQRCCTPGLPWSCAGTSIWDIPPMYCMGPSLVGIQVVRIIQPWKRGDLSTYLRWRQRKELDSALPRWFKCTLSRSALKTKIWGLFFNRDTPFWSCSAWDRLY